jgi:hypothetical protein
MLLVVLYLSRNLSGDDTMVYESVPHACGPETAPKFIRSPKEGDYAMRIMVLGGAGKMGCIAVQDLAGNRLVDESSWPTSTTLGTARRRFIKIQGHRITV